MEGHDGWIFTGRAVRGHRLYYHRNRATGVVRYRARRDGGRWTPAYTSPEAVDRWLAVVGGHGPLGGKVRHLRAGRGRTYCGLDAEGVHTDAPALAECERCFALYARGTGTPAVEDGLTALTSRRGE